MNDIQKQVENDYKLGLKLKEISQKYSVNENTIKSWAKRNGWSRKKVATKKSKSCTQNKKSCSEKVANDSPKNLNEKLFESVDANAELTEKQKLFCVFYVQSFNATQAYLQAYGGSRNVAGISGHELLKIPKIQAEIKKLKKETRKYFDVGFEDYVNYLLKIVGARISDFVEFGNVKGKNFVKLKNSDSVEDSALIEVRQVKGDVSIRLEDKKWAWEKLAKIFGFDEYNKNSDVPIVISGDEKLEN